MDENRGKDQTVGKEEFMGNETLKKRQKEAARREKERKKAALLMERRKEKSQAETLVHPDNPNLAESVARRGPTIL
jgi:streptomycin 6-kinase